MTRKIILTKENCEFLSQDEFNCKTNLKNCIEAIKDRFSIIGYISLGSIYEMLNVNEIDYNFYGVKNWFYLDEGPIKLTVKGNEACYIVTIEQTKRA